MPVGGQHLITDVIARVELDANQIQVFMEDIVKALDLHVVQWWAQVFPNGGRFGPGITAMMVLSESHFVIHTAPERQSVNLDLFSCRPFEDMKVRAAMNKVWDVQHWARWEVLTR